MRRKEAERKYWKENVFKSAVEVKRNKIKKNYKKKIKHKKSWRKKMQQTVVDLVSSSGRKWINHTVEVDVERKKNNHRTKQKLLKKWFDYNNWNNIDYMFNKIT